MKDILWELGKDILGNLDKTAALSGGTPLSAFSPAAFKNYNALNFILNALDRLEVRGRDSAGIVVTYTLPDRATLDDILLGLKDANLYDEFMKRACPNDLANGTIAVSQPLPMGPSTPDGPISVSFTYKTFSIIGELGEKYSGNKTGRLKGQDSIRICPSGNAL